MGWDDRWPRMGVVLSADVQPPPQESAARVSRRLDAVLAQHVGEYGGTLLPAHSSAPAQGGALLAVFGSLPNAVRCAEAMQRGSASENALLPAAERSALRIGICRGEVSGSAPVPASALVEAAVRLRESADAGQTAIAPVPAAAMRLRSGGSRTEPLRRWALLFAGVQASCLLAYFLGWYALITWKALHYTQHGGFSCWPAWLC